MGGIRQRSHPTGHLNPSVSSLTKPNPLPGVPFLLYLGYWDMGEIVNMESAKHFHVGYQGGRSEPVGKYKDAGNNKEEGMDKGDEVTGWRIYIGILFAILSSLMFELGNLMAKLMPQYHPYEMTLWRFQGVLLPAIPLLIYFRVFKEETVFDGILPFRAPGQRKILLLLFIRVISGTSAYILRFYSMRYISVADSSVIGVSTPVFVSLASHFLLKEKSGVIPIICGLIALAGVTIITRPPILTGAESFDMQTLIGTGFALGAMLCLGTIFLLLRYLRQLHFSVLTASFGIWGTFQSLALTATISKLPIPEGLPDWGMAAAMAVCAFLELTFITLALRYEEASLCALCRTCDVLFAYLWQFVFLGEIPDKYSWIGGAIVICGVLVAALRKYLGELPEDSRTRKRLWIFLA